jgi:hypothetical protein
VDFHDERVYPHDLARPFSITSYDLEFIEMGSFPGRGRRDPPPARPRKAGPPRPRPTPNAAAPAGRAKKRQYGFRKLFVIPDFGNGFVPFLVQSERLRI